MADVTDDKKKPLTDEKFLFAIIKQLDGTIDWQKVADEAGIISKGAANKRFSRMKIRLEGEEGGSPTKATTPAANGEDESPKKTPAKRTPAKKTPNKKRKLEEAVEEVEEKPVKGEEEEEA